MGKVIILVPKLNLIGGIANYYDAIRPYLSNDISYFVRGSRGFRSKLLRMAVFGYDIIRFIGVLIFSNPDVIVINTSMGQQSMRRDAYFFMIAKKYFRKKVIVFFRGWDDTFLSGNPLPEWFKTSYLLADKTIVLAGKFKDQLQSAGYLNPIVVETTVVSRELLEMVSDADRKNEVFSVLFMARIEQDKGIFEVIRAAQQLMKDNEKVRFEIVGTGSSLKTAQALTTSLGVTNVTFHGFVKGMEKAQLLKGSSVFLFPSSHGEGMPNAVLEAMASGLPVITTNVGGICDFFIHEKMGFIIDGSVEEILFSLKRLIQSPELCASIAENNKRYAYQRFLADKVAKRLQNHLVFDE